jgi:pimeloyl-ACP methyl ester carboxylesterase
VTPIAFNDCFGWIHQPKEGVMGDTGVILCSGLSQEASSAHRPFRQLADSLARAGYPAIRFDYPGTGDSCDEAGTEAWDAWLKSIHAAADWIRARTGVERVVLIGLRIGAMLAALVAQQRKDVAGLVLLEPVLRGRSFVSQLRVEASLRGAPNAPQEGIELGELVLSPVSMALIRAVDLLDLRLPAGCKVAIHARRQTEALTERAAAWRMAGHDVSCQSFSKLEAFLRPSHLADEADADVSDILAWLARSIAPSDRRPATDLAIDEPALRSEDWIETPLRFGTDRRLFGMLCRPAGLQTDLAIVIGNSAGNPHYGFARFSVEFARRLAQAGIASLRIDFAGLGDSVVRSGEAEACTHVFEVDRSSDMSDALDALENLGYRRFGAHGLCSGAYHALHAALADARFGALLTINLPWITLRHERPNPASIAQRAMDSLAKRAVASLLLFGEADSGLKGLEKHFGAACAALQTAETMTVQVVAGLDHELTGSAMRRLAADRMIDFLQGFVDPKRLQVAADCSHVATLPEPIA